MDETERMKSCLLLTDGGIVFVIALWHFSGVMQFPPTRSALLPATGSSSSSSSDSLSVRSEILKSEDVSLSYRLSPCPEPLSSSPPSDQGEAEANAGTVGVAVSPASEVTALPLSLSK